MKQYLTLAAYLAAGCAIANAVTLDDAFFSALYPEEESYDLTSYEHNTSKAFSYTYTVDVDLLDDILGATTNGPTAANSPTLVSVSAGNTRTYGTGLGYSSSNNVIVKAGVYTTLTVAGTDTKVEGYRSGSNLVGQDLCDVSDILAFAVTLAYSNLASGDDAGTTFYATILKKDGTSTTTKYRDPGLRWTNSDVKVPQILNINQSAGIESAYVFNSFLGEVDAEAINLMAISAIPEPSAFGLLAGLGALALVGTRRRKKA